MTQYAVPQFYTYVKKDEGQWFGSSFGGWDEIEITPTVLIFIVLKLLANVILGT